MSRIAVGCLLALSCALASACGDDSSGGTDRNTVPMGDGDAVGDGDGDAVGDGDGDGDGASGTGGDGDGDADTTALFGTEPTRNDVTPGSICARLATIQCAGEQTCCDAPASDFASCKAAAQTACSATLSLDAVAGDPVVGFDAAAASAAFTAFENLAKACDPSAASWALSPDGFTSSFSGTLDAGADCQPEGGLEADLPVIFAALASCTNVAAQACLPTETDWTCAARAAAGSACFTDLNCQDGLFCDPPTTLMGVCTARKADGGACLSGNECASSLCIGDVCAPSGDVQAAYCM